MCILCREAAHIDSPVVREIRKECWVDFIVRRSQEQTQHQYVGHANTEGRKSWETHLAPRQFIWNDYGRLVDPLLQPRIAARLLRSWKLAERARVRERTKSRRLFVGSANPKEEKSAGQR
jgi:hypothetical protein